VETPSQGVCKGARFSVEGERCVVSSWSLFKRFEVNEEEEEGGRWRPGTDFEGLLKEGFGLLEVAVEPRAVRFLLDPTHPLGDLGESSVRSYFVGNAGSRPISEAKQP